MSDAESGPAARAKSSMLERSKSGTVIVNAGYATDGTISGEVKGPDAEVNSRPRRAPLPRANTHGGATGRRLPNGGRTDQAMAAEPDRRPGCGPSANRPRPSLRPARQGIEPSRLRAWRRCPGFDQLRAAPDPAPRVKQPPERQTLRVAFRVTVARAYRPWSVAQPTS